MATYTKSMIKKALSFWNFRLNESEKKDTSESEEDQKKEAAAEQDDAEDTGAEDAEDTSSEDTEEAEAEGDAGADAKDDADTEDDFDPEADFAAAADDDEELGIGGDDSGDEAEASDDEASDDEASDDEASDDEAETSDENAEDAEGESEFKLEITAPSKKLLSAIPGLCKKFGSKISVTMVGIDPEGDDEEGGYVTAIECADQETFDAVKEEEEVKNAVGGMDGELSESVKYEPNTVGAVIKLLSKSDPRDYLFLRLAPDMRQCMVYDIDRRVLAEGRSTTYMELAVGKPDEK